MTDQARLGGSVHQNKISYHEEVAQSSNEEIRPPCKGLSILDLDVMQVYLRFVFVFVFVVAA